MAEVIESVGVRRFTVEEYHHMAQGGVFGPEERVELIRGVIRKKTHKGRRHAVAVAKANQFFTVRLAGRAGVFVQHPLLKKDFHSEPEPDVLITSNPDPDSYGTEQSSPLLVIEVADSSLRYDRNTKLALYQRRRYPSTGLSISWAMSSKSSTSRGPARMNHGPFSGRDNESLHGLGRMLRST